MSLRNVFVIVGCAPILFLFPAAGQGTISSSVSLSRGIALQPASPFANQATTVTFSIQNRGTAAVTIPYVLAGVRNAANQNLDFPARAQVALAPGATYSYVASRSFPASGTYRIWPAVFDGTNWIQLAAASAFTVQAATPGKLMITSALTLTPAAPAAGQSVTARFTVQNTGGEAVSVRYFLVGARSPTGGNYDFPPSGQAVVAPGASYTYSGTRTFATRGTYTVWPAYYDGTNWVQLAPASDVSVTDPPPAKLTVTSALTLAPSTPTAGQTVSAQFTVQNMGGQSATVRFLTGARDAANNNVDFPLSANVTLAGGSSYTYTASRAFTTSGTYMVWPAYTDGTNWVQLAPTTTVQISGGNPDGPVSYNYNPPAQTIHDGSQVFTIPAGMVYQKAWNDRAEGDVIPYINGVYAADYNGWQSVVFRWADTMRTDAIQRWNMPNGKPAYRIQLTMNDGASPGTLGGNPRAELFSVDATEARREHVPPIPNQLWEGDEYWIRFAVFFPNDFPRNHKWATLIQRKFDNKVPSREAYGMNWFGVTVHGQQLTLSVPGEPLDQIMRMDDLQNVLGKWVLFEVHEKISSGPDGIFEFWMNGVKKAERRAPTVPAGSIHPMGRILYTFHYGYYRSNVGEDGQPVGTGVVYYSPLMMFRGAQPGTNRPALP